GDGVAGLDRRWRDDRGPARQVQGVPADGDLDDLRGRADRRHGRDALENRRLLRRRGGRRRERPALPHGADHDRSAGRDRRRHGHRHVPADLRHGERGAIAPQMIAPDPLSPADAREPRPARTGTLRHDTVPMRLYHEAKRLGAWDPRSLDLRRDIEEWARFSVAERDVLLRLTVLFQAAQAEALVTYSLVGEGVLGDAGYHLFSTALARGDSLPGFREGLTHSQADEDRHMAYGLFVLSRLVAEAPEVWSAVSQRMEELLPLTLGIVSEFFEAYDPMPFGLSLDDTVQDAIARFASRWAALEGARAQGKALAGAVGTERTIRDLLGWVGEQLQPAPIEVRREVSSPVYTF